MPKNQNKEKKTQLKKTPRTSTPTQKKPDANTRETKSFTFIDSVCFERGLLLVSFVFLIEDKKNQIESCSFF